MKAFFGIAALAFAITSATTSLQAQSASERTVEQYKCRDFMRESGGNRDVAIAFLHGYLLGKSGSSKFDLETLKKQSDEFVEQCLSNPDAQGMTILQQIKK